MFSRDGFARHQEGRDFMPYIAPKPSLSKTIMFRVAAMAWCNHLRCRVRRCRRNSCCLGPVIYFGMPQCVRDASSAETSRMLDFLADTIDLATPERVTESLEQATTNEEREMIAFRRSIFLHYHQELANAGLAEPLGPPFVEGKVSP
jgi:hypothetical protein